MKYMNSNNKKKMCARYSNELSVRIEPMLYEAMVKHVEQQAITKSSFIRKAINNELQQ